MDPNSMYADLSVFANQLANWAATSVPNLFASVLILAAGWWFAGWAERTVRHFLEHTARVELTLQSVIASLLRYSILLLVMVAVLGQLGIHTTSVLAALGAVGLAIGLALQNTLANVAAGIMLLWLRPFKIGDAIAVGAVTGTVKEIGIFASHIYSADGVFQFVPNSELWNKHVVNYSRLPTRLVDLRFSIAYDNSTIEAREVLMRLATSDERVHKVPAPEVFVDKLGDSGVALGLRVWTDTSQYWAVRCALIEQGKLALEKAGLTIPFPQQDVHYRDGPARAE